jgi:DNA-binding HxlR family transcriptional regulator
LYFCAKLAGERTNLNNSPENEYHMATKVKECSSNAYNLKVLAASCEVNEILQHISPRWKMQILHAIAHDIQQFSTLKKAFPSLSDQILGKRLKELSEEGLVDKNTIVNTIPSQTLYSATPRGMELLAIIHQLHLWGLKESI